MIKFYEYYMNAYEEQIVCVSKDYVLLIGIFTFFSVISENSVLILYYHLIIYLYILFASFGEHTKLANENSLSIYHSTSVTYILKYFVVILLCTWISVIVTFCSASIL